MAPYSRIEGVLHVIKRDHQRIVALLASLVSQPDPLLRWEIFDDLRRLLDAHARAERAAFYPLFGNDRLWSSALSADHEHGAIQAIVDELAASRPLTTAWYELSRQLRHQVESHLASEESCLFDALRTSEQPATLRMLGERMLQIHRGVPQAAQPAAPSL